MKRVMLAVALVLLLIVGFAAAKSIAHGTMSRSGEASEVDNLIGTTVQDSKGEDLGTIAEVVAGPEGRLAFAILNYWVSDDTQKRIAVPLKALSCGEEICIVNASKDTFDSAPALGSEDDLVEPKMAGDVYRYFGALPYWTEEESEK